MTTCWNCDIEVPNGAFRCKDCLESITQAQEKRRRPLTEWEELKLRFYKDEKFWENSVRTREVKKDKHGNKVAFHRNKRGKLEPIPSQPRQLWPEPKEVN